VTLDIKQRGERSGAPEVRAYPASFEVRTLTGTKVELSGYASTTEQPYQMFDFFGDYTEVVRGGAFGKTIADGAAVSYLANHEGLTMASTKAGSLRLSEDSTGLLTLATLNTSRGDVRDLVTAVEDGDISEMSFAFRVMRQQWSPDYDERSLVELNLDKGDVSAVNFGANPTTNVGLARAFRSRRPAEVHRMAVEVREDGTLSDATRGVLAHVLDLIAAADQGVDKAQPLLADILGVPNPDADDKDAERAAAAMLELRYAEMREAERLGRKSS
jgi:hypothetical protein